MKEMIKVSRRDFLKNGTLVGGGLLLGFSLPLRGSLGRAATEKAAPIVPNAFIHIGTDNTVTIIVNHSEMGQGVYTSLPMLVAEELEADWTKIKVAPAPVDPVYTHTAFGIQMTGGSTSVWSEYDRLRKVGAAAREMLIAAAAATWKVDKASCRAEKGKVIHQTGKSLTFGQLAASLQTNPLPCLCPRT
jgi:isoquinoline 1-oxidoreductase beta subunit